MTAPEGAWDRQWTLVQFRLGEGSRTVRDRLRDLLNTESFAALGPGVYIHPRDRSSAIGRAFMGTAEASRLRIFRGPRLAPPLDDRVFVRELWPLDDIAERYRAFLARYRPVARRTSKWPPLEAAAARFAIVFDYLAVAWGDPDLPEELLPTGWPGHTARSLVARLYRQLTPGARAYGEEIARRIALP